MSLAKALRVWFQRIAGLFLKSKRDTEFAAELESHLQLHIEDSLRAGMNPETARRDALIKLGGVEQIKERFREQRGLPLIETLLQDLRFGLRMLRKNPGFTIVAVLTLALGIGANTAIFSVVNAVLLRPLPYADANRLVMVWATDERRGVKEDVTSFPNFEDWRAQSKSFQAIAAFTGRSAVVSLGGEAELMPAFQGTPGIFELLGVTPELGRTFRPEEVEPGSPHVLLLSDTFWRERFGARPDVIGRVLRVNEELYTVVGVAPPGLKLSFSKSEPIYMPLVRDPNRGHGFLKVLGRLRPNVSLHTAQTEMNIIARANIRSKTAMLV